MKKILYLFLFILSASLVFSSCDGLNLDDLLKQLDNANQNSNGHNDTKNKNDKELMRSLPNPHAVKKAITITLPGSGDWTMTFEGAITHTIDTPNTWGNQYYALELAEGETVTITIINNGYEDFEVSYAVTNPWNNNRYNFYEVYAGSSLSRRISADSNTIISQRHYTSYPTHSYGYGRYSRHYY